MTPADFLLQLRNLGVKIWVEGDQLRLSAPKNVVTPQLRAQLKERKAELIRFLRERTGSDRATIPTVARNGDLPLSFAQQGLWFVYQFLDHDSGDGSAYNISQVLALRGDLDVDALAWSLGEVVCRHESLRTTFALRNDQPLQVISEPGEVELPVIDVSSHADPRGEGMRRADETAWQGFDLAVAPLFRCRLVRIADDEHLLAVAMPHIVGDGWSYGVFWREVGQLYAARVAGADPALDDLAIQYADHAAWQRQWYETESDKLLEFWRNQLADLPTLEFPADHPRPSTQTFRGARHSFSIPKAGVDGLTAIGREEGCTFFMTMLALYDAWIARYTDCDDIVVGTPIANRHRVETEPLIGLFVNSLVLRTDVSGDPDFRECLRRVRETAVQAYQHPEMPFEQLVLELSPERNPSRNPLFQLAFAVDEPAPEIAIGDLDVESIELEQVTAKFDLTLGLRETSDGMVGIFEYNCDLFDEDTVRRMGEHFCQLLAACAQDPDAPISDHSILTAAERELLIAPADRREPYANDLCVHERVAEQAAERPDALAVSGPDGTLTFSELDSRANQIAHFLRTRKVGPDVLVGVLMERTPEMVAALLGVLKAGGAYVPLDPANPGQRQALVLEDAQVPILLTQESLAPVLPDFAGELVVLDRDGCTVWEQSADEPERLAGLDDLAYVVFTSGSTGRPKGVEITHKSLLNLAQWSIDLFEVTPADRVAQVANLAFDAAMWEFWAHLIAGASVHQPHDDVRKEPELLLSWMGEQGITLCFITTALGVAMWQEKAPNGLALRWMLTGGEKMKYPPPPGLPYRVMHVYGPTEGTIYSTNVPLEPGHPDDPPPPIGRALRNVETWVLDRHRQPVPIGVPGELYLGGDGLARGYHNRPELTEERFVAHPFKSGQRLYKTGDVVRYLRDGNIDFLGRVDHQIKLRGFRIELGEIEHVLAQHTDVVECIVVAQDRRLGDMQLAAYVVLAAGAGTKVQDLRDHFHGSLPDFMVPPAIVLLDKLPLNPNGKVDRAALSATEAERGSDADDYLPPRTPMEERVAEIWKSVLDIERVGREDNFFDLGGHSLLIVRLHKKLREVFDTDLSIAEMFHYSTVAAMADRLGGEVGAASFAEVQRRVAKATAGDPGGATTEPIAVVGLSGRFPDARNVAEFWKNISGGLESISFFTDDDLRHSGLPAALWKHPDYVKARAILDDIELFDAAFFGINAREAQATDPQQRLFLEVAYEAMESAGYDPLRCPRSVGVFGGCGPNSYYRNNLCANREFMESIGALETSLIDRAFLTTRVAYQLNLKGPALDIYSACSTSLAAIAYACQSLQDHHCDMALAGGVSVYSPQRVGHLYKEGQIFSPDGHCRPFDAKAKGTLSGEAVGVVVLKRLSDALADGDHVHAVIKGIGINNDGSDKVGFTAPSVEGQAEAIAMALAQAGASPETIGYVEAHGTATPLGDPVEIAALTRAYRASTDKVGYCAIGSVKSNIGHTDTAAGVAGFIKAVLSLENRVIPPSLNYEKPNPEIDFEDSPFFVNAAPRMWKGDDTPRRAGVSSFGIGGTNVHLVVEEAPAAAEPVAESNGPELVVFSAKTKSALQRATDNLAAHLTENRELRLADLAFTAQQSRSGFIHRRAVVCRDLRDAIDALAGNAPDRMFTGRQQIEDPPVAFMFPGQGAQYVGMGRELYDALPVFREYLDKCADVLAPELGFDLREVLFAGEEQAEEAAAKLEQTGLTQPAIFSIEYALAQQWMAWGVRPAAMIGHSVGEYVAATLADVLSLEDALRLVAARGRLMQALPLGDMLSVPLSEDEVRPLLGDELSLAAVNGPTSCVVSGPAAAVGLLKEQLAAKDLPCRLLHTSHAFHSSMMEPIVEPFAELVKQVPLSPARIDCVSTVTGERIAPEDWADPNYWARNLREPVRFSDGAEVLLEGADYVLLEVGPGQTLNALVRQHKAEAAGRAIVASMRHPQKRQPDLDCLLAAAGRLWIAGVQLDWQQLQGGQDGGQGRRRVALPSYPFARERYWIDPSPQEEGGAAVSPAVPAAAPVTTGKRTDVGDWFSVPSWRRTGAPRAGATTDDGWLVLTDAADLGERLVARLRSDGKCVVTVCPGDEFAENGENGYTVRPDSRADFDSLMAALRGRGVTPSRVVHLWNVVAAAEPPVQLDSLDRSQSLGFFSTLFLVQALGDAFAAEAAQIDVVTNDLFDVLGGEAVHPERATVLGPVRVAPQEYENLNARCIDVQLPAASDVEGGDRLVDQVMAELAAEIREPVVAYRGAYRWAEAYDSVHLPAPASSTVGLREGGVYLITGGLGGIGLVVAEYLAEVARAKLVLVGRSGLPPKRKWDAWLKGHGEEDRISRRIRKVRKLEELGAEVVVASADVANLEQMREVVGRAHVRFGAIHGVIHSAGLSTGGLAAVRTAKAAAEVLDPKVRGTLVLRELLANDELDVFVLCSSGSSILGGVGGADYCGANAFLDALANSSDLGHNARYVAVNWDAWTEVGMSAEIEVPEEMRAGRDRDLATGILNSEGRQAFARIFADPQPQLVVITRDLSERLRESREQGLGRFEPPPVAAGATETAPTTLEADAAPAAAPKSSSSLHPRPELPSEYVAPRTATEQTLAEVAQDLLGIDMVGIHDNFFDLGFDSLLAHRMIGRLKDSLAMAIPLRVILEMPTVGELARFVDGLGSSLATSQASDP